MNLPLARLRRGTQQVWLHDRLSPPPAAAPPAPPAAPPAVPKGAAPAAAAHAAAQPFRIMGATPAAPAPTPTHAPTATPSSAFTPALPPASETPATEFDVTQAQRRDFWRADDAVQYLHWWRNDAAACRELRTVLQRLEPSTWVFAHTDDRVIQALGAAIAQGLVVVSESAQAAPAAGLPGVPAPPAAPAAPLALTVAPIKPPVPPLLPILEEIQIEGAEVLPEILQSLEQIDLTLGEIRIAPVSLAPTPSKIPEIESAMTAASGSVTKTLDEL